MINNPVTDLFSQLPFRFRRSILLLSLLSFIAVPIFAEDDVKPNSDDPRSLVKQGEKLIRKGDFAGAEQLFKRAIEARPNDSEIKLKLAYLYVRTRRFVEAYELSFPILRNEPKNSYAFAVVGATYLGAGRFRDARMLLVSSIRLKTDQPLAWAAMGMLDFYENKIQESLKNLEEAVYHDPFEPDFLYALAQVSARAEKYREAATAYEGFLRVSRNTDDDRRERIKGLINFLRYLGNKQYLYQTGGQDATEVKFDLVGNRPIIQMRVNGKPEPLNFVLDTGSGISVISDETAKALGIKAITKGGFAKGIGGSGKFEIVYGFIRDVDIGAVTVRNVPVYIRKFHSDGKIDGYIGLSLISKFLTTVDYGNQTFGLRKKDSIRTDDPTGVSVPLRLTSSGFLSGEVQLEGFDSPLNFIVDTGASVSVISSDLAANIAMAPHAQEERMRVIGAAGITEDVPSFLLPKVTMGTHSRNSITAIALDLNLINEASGFEQAGILGGNFLKNYRMTFDFQNSRVTFVSVRDQE
ncbi:MAG: aspartyl protease family protein [Pyrinomonadaceae bacterium]